MQAIIMAAGKGVRMLPLTEGTPKPLLKVKDKSILKRTIEQLPDQIDEVIVVIGYLGEQIKKAIGTESDGKKITYVESETLGTGYAVHKCKDLIKGDFLVVNGDDLYTKDDLEKIITTDGLAIAVKDVSKEPEFPAAYKRFGRVIVNDQTEFVSLATDKVETPFYVVIGVYKLTQEFFNYPLIKIPSGESGLPQTIFSMIDKHKIKVVEANFWIPIGFPDDIQKAEAKLSV